MNKSTPEARVGNITAEESQVRSSILIPLAQLFKRYYDTDLRPIRIPGFISDQSTTNSFHSAKESNLKMMKFSYNKMLNL